MSKPKFCLYIFGPIIFQYFLPVIAYEWPIKILTIEATHEIKLINLAMAIVACVVWFGIAILIICYPHFIPIKKSPPRYWTQKARWMAFLLFSVFGCFIAILHRFFLMPVAIEQLIHQLSLMPTIGLILGLCCLQDLENRGQIDLKKFLIFSLMGLDALIVFALQIVFGVIGGVAISAIAILFGMSFIGIRPVKQIVGLFIFSVIIFGGLSIKKEIGVLMCEGVCERVSIKKFFKKEKEIELAGKQTLPHEEKIPKTHRLLEIFESPIEESGKKQDLPLKRKSLNTHEFIKSLESQKEILESFQDPNFMTIRFMPTFLEKSIFHYFVARVIHRLNHIGELGYVIQTTDDEIPFSYGQTYFPLLSKFIPRLIWPEKPVENFAQYFGHRYGFLHDADLKTSINLPLIVEGYINWGWFGIVFSALLVGIVLRLLWEFWIGEIRATGNVILGMVVVINMVLQEANLSLLMGGLLYGGLVYWSLEIFFRNWFNSKQVVRLTTRPSITKV